MSDPSPEVVVIAAMSANRVIGREGRLPWHLPKDLRRFRQLTRGHPLVMGRHTFASAGGALPERRNIVLTRNADYRAEGAEIAHTLAEALELCAGASQVFIGGGEEVYREALDLAHRIELTLVHAEVEGDTRFPEFDDEAWERVAEEHHEADDAHAHPFTFLTYRRSGTAGGHGIP